MRSKSTIEGKASRYKLFKSTNSTEIIFSDEIRTSNVTGDSITLDFPQKEFDCKSLYYKVNFESRPLWNEKQSLMLNYEIGVVKNFTFKDLDPWTNYTFSITAWL